MHATRGPLLLLFLGATVIGGCDRSSEKVPVENRVVITDNGEKLRVGLQGGSFERARRARGRRRLAFPAEVMSQVTTIDDLFFVGFTAVDYDSRIEVLAARAEDEPKRFRIIADTTLPINVEIEYGKDASTSQWKVFYRHLDKGHHDIILTVE
jgi:hypothetical protein